VSELRFAEIVGREVLTPEGGRLGHVFDVHLEPVEGKLRVAHLLVGHWGLAARLSLDVSWRLPGEQISWDRVVEALDDRIVVRAQ
jgi:sporulation protein YlmC with PRC-barrel domain